MPQVSRKFDFAAVAAVAAVAAAVAIGAGPIGGAAINDQSKITVLKHTEASAPGTIRTSAHGLGNTSGMGRCAHLA